MLRGANVFNNKLNNLKVPTGAVPASWSTHVRDSITTSSPSVSLYHNDGKLHVYTGGEQIFNDASNDETQKVDGSLVSARAVIEIADMTAAAARDALLSGGVGGGGTHTTHTVNTITQIQPEVAEKYIYTNNPPSLYFLQATQLTPAQIMPAAWSTTKAILQFTFSGSTSAAPPWSDAGARAYVVLASSNLTVYDKNDSGFKLVHDLGTLPTGESSMLVDVAVFHKNSLVAEWGGSLDLN